MKNITPIEILKSNNGNAYLKIFRSALLDIPDNSATQREISRMNPAILKMLPSEFGIVAKKIMKPSSDWMCYIVKKRAHINYNPKAYARMPKSHPL
ncbi:MAG: hypothetical protein E4G94_03975 [ANME-2 cluster archaeon]|nr:MAG: hypothetical protein E4G94_03975 [ANME-2 cluster archaeon]